MRPRRTSEGKPRRSKSRGVGSRRDVPRRQIVGINQEEASRSGSFLVRDHSPSGNTSGLVMGTTQTSSLLPIDPAVNLSLYLRRMMRPLRVAPTKVYDGEGKLVRTITVDPVSGKRVSTPAPRR